MNELAYFLNKIPNGMESEYGFQNREDFQKAKLLNPMNIIFPTSEYYENELVDSTKRNLYSSNNWKIPIEADNKVCCFLQGILNGNTFKVTSIGGNDVAQMFNNFRINNSNTDKIHYDIILFPTIKKMYLIQNDNRLDNYQSEIIPMDESRECNANAEQKLFETILECKVYINHQKRRNND